MTTLAQRNSEFQAVRKQQVNEVIIFVFDGLPLREALKRAHLEPRAFYHFLSQDREAAQSYARALEIKADMLADEVVAIADSDADPAKARNQMTARQWLASKLYAKRYGDRIDLNVTQTLDIGSTLAEARARLRPVSDQSDITDAQVIDAKQITVARAGDIKSILASDPCKAPDIFD